MVGSAFEAGLGVVVGGLLFDGCLSGGVGGLVSGLGGVKRRVSFMGAESGCTLQNGEKTGTIPLESLAKFSFVASNKV